MSIGTIVALRYYPKDLNPNTRIVYNEASTLLMVICKGKLISFEVHELLQTVKKFIFTKSYVSLISLKLENQTILINKDKSLNTEHFKELVEHFAF